MTTSPGEQTLPCRVVLADDHALVREVVKLALESQAGRFRVCHEVATCSEVSALLGRTDWDVLVLDLDLPDGDGFEVLASAAQAQPRRPVLVLSAASASVFGARALACGAASYLQKQDGVRALVEALEGVARRDPPAPSPDRRPE